MPKVTPAAVKEVRMLTSVRLCCGSTNGAGKHNWLPPARRLASSVQTVALSCTTWLGQAALCALAAMEAALQLVQADAADLQEPLRVWLMLGSNAQASSRTMVSRHPCLAGLYGLARTARLEVPALPLRCLDTNASLLSTPTTWPLGRASYYMFG